MANAVAVVRAWLVAEGSPVLALCAAGDVRVDRLPDGHDGRRGGVVLLRMGGGPLVGADAEEAMVSLRVYGDGTRAGVDAVVEAVVDRLHMAYGRATAAGLLVMADVASVSGMEDGEFEDVVPMAVVLVNVVVGRG